MTQDTDRRILGSSAPIDFAYSTVGDVWRHCHNRRADDDPGTPDVAQDLLTRAWHARLDSAHPGHQANLVVHTHLCHGPYRPPSLVECIVLDEGAEHIAYRYHAEGQTQPWHLGTIEDMIALAIHHYEAEGDA